MKEIGSLVMRRATASSPVLACCLAIVIAAVDPRPVPADGVLVAPGTTPPPPVDFAEFLIGQDLVVEGTLAAVDTVVRTPVGGCGASGFGTRAAQDYTIHIGQVIYGTAEDSSVVISDLVRDVFPEGVLVPGARVLGWGFRNCIDGWRIWGNVAVITEGGQLVGHLGSEPGLWVKGTPRGQPVAYGALETALSAGEESNGTTYFRGKQAVALLLLTDIEVHEDGSVSYACDSLGWAMGSAAGVPRHLDFPQMGFCYFGAHRGDSLVVPVPAVVGYRLAINACPKAFQVRDNYLPGFGVTIEFLSWALEQREAGYAVRPFLEGQ